MRDARTRLGFYMYAPALGGAERYLRDLVWGVPRDEFEVFVLYPPWEAFERFLGLGQAPLLHAAPVRTIEASRRREPGSDTAQVTPASTRPASGSPLPPTLREFASKCGRYGLWTWNYPILRQMLSRIRLDVLHVVNGGYPVASSGQAAVIAARRAGVRARVMTIASTPMPRWRPKSIERAIDGAMARAVDAFILPSLGASDTLVERRGMSNGACREVPWGPHAPDAELATGERRERVRAALRVPAHVALIIIIVASFQPTKGHLALVDALAKLRREGLRVHALFVGDGPVRPEVERRAVEAGIRDAIVFAGRLPDPADTDRDHPHVYEALQVSDAFVLPSEIEGLPYAVLEAMWSRRTSTIWPRRCDGRLRTLLVPPPWGKPADAGILTGSHPR